jgi:starch phosphorylase
LLLHHLKTGSRSNYTPIGHYRSLIDLMTASGDQQFCADGAGGNPPVRQEMKIVRPLDGAVAGLVYGAAVSATRPPTDYPARVIPHCDGVAIPLEVARILWQR